MLRKADLLRLDGERLRAEMVAGGAWAAADPQWVALVRGKMGWHRDVVSPAVPMPERSGEIMVA